MGKDDVMRVRRVTVYLDRARRYRLRVQAGNWQRIENDQSFGTERAAQLKALRLFPQLEELVDTHGASFMFDELERLKQRLIK